MKTKKIMTKINEDEDNKVETTINSRQEKLRNKDRPLLVRGGKPTTFIGERQKEK